jgi:hypothetical protein
LNNEISGTIGNIDDFENDNKSKLVEKIDDLKNNFKTLLTPLSVQIIGQNILYR